MPRKKIACPECGAPMSPRAKTCRQCSQPYERTPEIREKMSQAQTGKPRPWQVGKKRPEHAQMMREWWTPERRENRRQEMLLLNPNARYHGLSCKGAKRLREAIGHCELCQHDGSESRLDVHHRDRNKRNPSPSNLVVLCHRCHMQVHAKTGETGWDSYWRKRRTTQDSATE